MQKGAFLIHSRNIHCDFPSTFAVCPSDLSSEEMEQMRSKSDGRGSQYGPETAAVATRDAVHDSSGIRASASRQVCA